MPEPFYECPDCNADTRLVQIAPGVLVLEVAHDDTCPQLAARTTPPPSTPVTKETHQ